MVAVQRIGLIEPVDDIQIDIAIAVVVGGEGGHTGSAVTEAHALGHLSKGAAAVVAVQQAWPGEVAHIDVEIAVAVEVEGHGSERVVAGAQGAHQIAAIGKAVRVNAGEQPVGRPEAVRREQIENTIAVEISENGARGHAVVADFGGQGHR